VSATATPASVCQNGSSQFNTSVTIYSSYCVTQQGGSPAITNVSFNTLSNPGVVSISPYFERYPFGGSTTTQVLQGSTYNFTVDASAVANAGVWIDYNRNGLYEASEFNSVLNGTASGTISIRIPGPDTALTGITGMRVRSRATNGTVTGTDGCSVFGSGSCQNYVITIGNPGSAIGYTWTPSTFLNNPSSFKITKNGVWGDPTKANRQDGRKIMSIAIKNIIRTIKELDELSR